MSKPELILDPGHGGKDEGGGSNDLWKEKNLVLDISRYQEERFRELGIPVAMTRREDVYLSPSERTRLVRESGASVCISNHINAAPSPSARGVETIHSIYSDGALARAIYEAVVAEGMPGRRVFTREGADGKDYYFMHRETGKVETVIVEYGFATNPGDKRLLKNHWRAYAEAVVRAYCRHAGHVYTAPEDRGTLPDVQGKARVVMENGSYAEGYLIENRVYVPARFVSEELGARISWDNETKTARIAPES